MNTAKHAAVVTALVLLGTASVSLAADYGTGTPMKKSTVPPKTMVVQPKLVAGSVSAVDLQSSTFTLATPEGKAWTIQTSPATRISAAGKPATIAELTAGKQVKVSYTSQGNVQVARSVEIQ